jgi:hypothetical protein
MLDCTARTHCGQNPTAGMSNKKTANIYSAQQADQTAEPREQNRQTQSQETRRPSEPFRSRAAAQVEMDLYLDSPTGAEDVSQEQQKQLPPPDLFLGTAGG